VVDHAGHEHTRVFRDVTDLGVELEQLKAVLGTRTEAEVGLIYDWENRWAIELAQGPRNLNKEYQETCESFYQPFWRRGIAVDVVDSQCAFAGYKLLVAPMLYMLRPGVAERLTAFVAGGGTLVTTYLTGIADESDLCFLGGFPGPLRPLLGLWTEETDVLLDSDVQTVQAHGNELGLMGGYTARHYCDIVHAESAEVLAAFEHQFYEGSPALTLNRYGQGRAYHVASRNEERFNIDLINGIVDELEIRGVLGETLPSGVSAQRRGAFVFVMNFCSDSKSIGLGDTEFVDAITRQQLPQAIELEGYGCVVLEDA
jgi:beta-galactosidase